MPLNVDVLNQSFALIVERNADVARRFFAILFERHPDTIAMFGGPEPSQRQRRMLARALIVFIAHLEEEEWLEEQLVTLGARHIDHGVEDHMYEWVGECLIAAFAEAAAEMWTQEAEDAWRAAYRAISSMAIEGARRRRLGLMAPPPPSRRHAS